MKLPGGSGQLETLRWNPNDESVATFRNGFTNPEKTILLRIVAV